MSNISVEKKGPGKKTKTVLVVLALLTVLVLCAVFISKYAKTLVTEGTVDLELPRAALTEIPKDGEGVIEYIQHLINSAKDNTTVSVDLSTSLSVDEGLLTANGSDAELNILKFAKNSVLAKLTEEYPAHDGAFGDGFADYPEITLTAADVLELSLTSGRLDDLGRAQDEDYYYFTLLLPDFDYPVSPSSAAYTTFGMDEISSIASAAKAAAADMLTVKSASLSCTGFTVEGRADKYTDRLDYITFVRSYSIALSVEFIGDYASFGVTEIAFPYTVTQTYDYTMAGFSFARDRLTLFKNEEEMLGVNAVIAEDATAEDYELTFTSSDESIATVDAEGIVKGVAVSTAPAVITATFKYMGNTYTDTCEVYVTVPVSRIKASPPSLSLTVGGTGTVDYVIEPDNATITSVLWFTEDSSVAVIDENGRVTGVGTGTVKVYAVTVDGGFRASCTVTVTDN